MSSSLSTLFKHGISYFVTQIALRLVGLVSFPIITRLLTVHDYGLLALLNTTLLLLYAIGKCGISNSLISSIKESSVDLVEKICCDSILAVSGVTFIVCFFYYLCLLAFDFFSFVPLIFYLLGPIVLFRNVFAALQAWLRAVGKIALHNKLVASFEIGSTSLVLLTLFMIKPTLLAMFDVKIIFESFFVLLLLLCLFLSFQNHRVTFDKKSIRNLLSFGFPLIWLELSMVLITFGDRYQIGYLMNAEAVGLYSAAYSLSQYVQEIISQPLMLAVYPIYNQLYVEEGREATISFLNTIVKWYFTVTIPIFILVSFYAKFFLSILASEKYASAAEIIPIVLVGNLFNGIIPLVSAGLYLSKKTTVIGKVTLLCALLNIILNFILIHLFGCIGAAISTLVSFLTLFVLIKKQSDKILKINASIRHCCICLLVAFLSLVPAIFLNIEGIWGVVFGGGIFIVIYITATVLLDGTIIYFIKRHF